MQCVCRCTVTWVTQGRSAVTLLARQQSRTLARLARTTLQTEDFPLTLPVPLRACTVQLSPTSSRTILRNPAIPCRSSSGAAPSSRQSSMQRLKVVMRDYGTVGVVFHTVISLCSLGTCYLVVSSGVDVGKVLEYFNVQSSTVSKGASVFALSYVLHKMFLPLRAAITVGSVPLIVRWLRARGWIKVVAKQPK